MANYVITKENGIKAIQDGVKEMLTQAIIKGLETLKAEGQIEEVGIVRTEGSSAKNVLGVKIGDIEKEGFSHDFCYTIDITAKAIDEKVTKRYTVPAFVWEEAVERYNNKVAEDKAKKEQVEKEKIEKKERDRKAREEKAKKNKESKGE